MRTTEPPLAGHLVLLDPIGVGGMGEVWRAWDLRGRRLVAAKVLGRYDDALLQRFVREQAVRVRHPHVVAPLDWAADGGRVVLTMDLVAGGSVETLRAEHGPLPEPLVALLLDQLLQALAAVHAAGVVHRDVKPANLLLQPGAVHLRLADFGVAAVLDGERLTGPGPVGTRGYVAPEAERGAPPHPRQDLYAVGVVGRELTGTPRGVLGPLLDALADPDPARRPPSAQEALIRLRRLPLPHPQWPPLPDRLGPAPIRGDPARTALVLACLCFALAGLLSLAVLVAT
ncbi:serine/threonine protein kinase [Nocardioides sp. cx-169]|uniref:serine/threonine-protein kinase n=1 Tax=Nocardioides sp. cx-169 TaxID=2899080 RepID=UPI001E4EF8BB|nr:serine/threonine-protein kinase [Nocardioides sp. cx-169]MCD4533154.1 serine/threonine protein kinase [Nocardioides sp. cx-169]